MEGYIIIAVPVAAAVLAIALWMLLRKQRDSSGVQSSNPSEEVPRSASTSSEEDSSYESEEEDCRSCSEIYACTWK